MGSSHSVRVPPTSSSCDNEHWSLQPVLCLSTKSTTHICGAFYAPVILARIKYGLKLDTRCRDVREGQREASAVMGEAISAVLLDGDGLWGFFRDELQKEFANRPAADTPAGMHFAVCDLRFS